MSDKIKVSVPQMKGKGEQIQQSIEASMKSINAMEAAVATLNGSWEGPAWSAYKKQFYDDVEFIFETYRVLKKYIEALSLAEEKYYKCDSQNCSEIKNIKV